MTDETDALVEKLTAAVEQATIELQGRGVRIATGYSDSAFIVRQVLPIIEADRAKVIDQAITNHRFELATAYASGHDAGVSEERVKVVDFVREWNGATSDGDTFFIASAIERGDHMKKPEL